jgi:cobalt-zinc-cadmium efflux system outer membrane protein
MVAAAQLRAAEAGRLTARAYPNPTLEVGGGPSLRRQPGVINGENWAVSIAQPLDYPAQRAARERSANASIESAAAGSEVFRVNLLAAVRGAFFDVLRRQGEFTLTSEDAELLQNVRSRVAVRVETGEASRFDLIRADAELLNANKLRESAELRVVQAKAALMRLTANALSREFTLRGELAANPEVPVLERVREESLARSPDYARAAAELKQAEARFGVERELRMPQITLLAGTDQDPDRRNLMLGMSVPLPLWNRREGPIAEAAAAAAAARARIDDLRLALTQEVDNAYQNYRINQRQVAAFEGGLLKQAEAALKVAEAAYRFGERGILDYLDAQRTHRTVRADYLSARFELQHSLIEIDRLRAADREGVFN